ncbi:MAG: hypothetical protein EBZ69_00725 [Alphaproteobacteria bacterium]|nr:hypothetical protein [Alphaproteobacteria bacterium]
MTAIMTTLRAAAGAALGAWIAVSIIGSLEKTMARDHEYGYLTVRWYVESLPWIVVIGGSIGAAIGAKARFPFEQNARK